MLFYQIYNIDYTPNYTWLKLKRSTIRGRLGHGAHQTVVWSSQWDLRSESDIWIQIKELLFDDGYLSGVMEDMKSWFTRMEVLDLIYHQYSSLPIAWGASQ
jgi:hypothetical protein